jgi:mRNA interferase RelE/StbE
MDQYKITIQRSAQRQLKKLGKSVAARLIPAMHDLANNPRPPHYKRLVDSPFYRIRVGDYRVIYEIDDGIKIISIIKIGHRKNVYE